MQNQENAITRSAIPVVLRGIHFASFLIILVILKHVEGILNLLHRKYVQHVPGKVKKKKLFP